MSVFSAKLIYIFNYLLAAKVHNRDTKLHKYYLAIK